MTDTGRFDLKVGGLRSTLSEPTVIDYAGKVEQNHLPMDSGGNNNSHSLTRADHEQMGAA